MTDKIQAYWEKVISKLQKYYPKAEFCQMEDGLEVMQIIVSPKKGWVLDLINTVYCNYDGDLHHNPTHPYMEWHRKSPSGCNSYDTPSCRYGVGCYPYLNGNTRITIIRKLK